MGTKTFKSHMIQKHDIASNWALSNFIPMKGELVVYDIDDTYSYERFKIGDGVTTAHNLPFVTDSIADSIDACKDLIGDTSVSAQISDAINGITLSNFGVAATSTELNKLNGMTATTTELNYVDGVTSNIQTQLNGKAASDHTHSSYVNQNAFSNVKVGTTTVAADTATDTLTLVGSNVTLTPDATNDQITIGITKNNVTAALGYTPPTTNTTYSAADSSLGLVKSGGDVTISGGVITVNDDSHNHTIANIDGLQTALNLIGDTSVSEQITAAIANKSDSGHTHDTRYYTESEIDTKLSGKANSSHGNHVPTVETANNAKFLRNDNTWQTVTPANIGAAAVSHGTHVSYSTIAPVMDGTASVGSASTVARSDHKHPTDTSRASASSVTALQSLVGDTAVSTQIASATSSLVKTVNGITPDTNGNVSVQAGVTSVNGKTGAVTINRESLSMVVSATEPSSPTTGMLWFDIS